MTTACFGATMAALLLGCTSITVAADPIPPLPLKSSLPSTSALPEMHSPCTFDLDAAWLRPLKFTHTESLKVRVPQPINCDGAVIESISASGGGSITLFQFKVAFRPGSDREAILSFGILDEEKQLVALGETSGNLDEGEDSFLSGSLTIKINELNRVFAKGQRPVLRVTLRVAEE